MFKLTIPIKFNSSVSNDTIYQFYYACLPRIKRNIKYFANKYNSNEINSRLLKSNNITFNYTATQFLYRDIILYALNNLYVYRDITGHIEYRVKPVRNIFAKNITFDQLLRLIEFGNENLKSLRIFNCAIVKSLPNILRVYNTAYNHKAIK